MFKNVSMEKIEEFIQKFPTAYSWLLGEELKGEKRELIKELKYTKPESKRTIWIKQRLNDLNEF